jgi:hypothetical protein
MVPELCKVLSQAVKTINFVKADAAYSQLFSMLCEEMICLTFHFFFTLIFIRILPEKILI